MTYSVLNIPKLSRLTQVALPLGAAVSAAAGAFIDPAFYAGTAGLGGLSAFDTYLRYFQTKHAILRNFGIVGAIRHGLESVGPELRQYVVANDTEERPFSRRARALLYRLGKGESGNVAFGTILDLEGRATILHTMCPVEDNEVMPFRLVFGEARDCRNPMIITNPIIVSGMSYGSIGKNATMALSKGAAMAGIPLNTGEGGLTEYHLYGGGNIILQLGTEKFGFRNPNSSLNEGKLLEAVRRYPIAAIELKGQQGAKPNGGGILLGDKVTEEIARIRGVPVGETIHSRRNHIECKDIPSTIDFIGYVQRLVEIPVGWKMCLGYVEGKGGFREFVHEMKRKDIFPDYIALDGAEGGTGAAPQELMDGVGVPIFPALETVNRVLEEESVRDRLKIIASGKLADPETQFRALAYGADAIAMARGFLIGGNGCIQAMDCSSGNCPSGNTTHDPRLQRGLVVEEKAVRVANLARNLHSGLTNLLAVTGRKSFYEIDRSLIREPERNYSKGSVNLPILR